MQGSPYQYTPYVWPMLAAAGIVGILSAYAWKRRAVAGAIPFAVMAAMGVPWGLGAVLELSAVHIPTKAFWVEFQRLWLLPTVTAGLWFALDYTNLNRWLTRRALAWLALPPIAHVLLALTNDSHHLIWRGYTFDGDVQLLSGKGGWMFTDYGLIIGVLTALVFVWIFLQSPLHRWPVALCLCAHLATRAAYLLDLAKANPVQPMDPMMLSLAVASPMYAVALFHFRLFDLVPITHATVIEQMREAMLVLDPRHRIVDLNAAAERLLGIDGRHALARQVEEVLPELAALEASPETASQATEIQRGAAASARYYSVHRSPLVDRRHHARGELVLLHDITDRKRAEAQLLDHQRAVATSQERERVARELHDSLGQVLGFLKMQSQAARALLARGEQPEADACLSRLTAVAQEAHVDVREYISAAHGAAAGRAFLSSLEHCVQGFRETSGIAADLEVPSGLASHPFDPTVEAQFLCMLQEALTNVRKHAAARQVRVRLALVGGRAEVTVHDDGAGFDPVSVDISNGRSFGLRFMRERAEAVGGTVCMRSAPGAGADVVISVPLRREPS